MRSEIFQNALNSIAEAGREILSRRSLIGNDKDEIKDSISQLCRDLLSEKGEALGTALACEVIDRYKQLGTEERLAFFVKLRDDFEPAQEALEKAIHTYLNDPSRENRQRLEQSVESPRQGLIRAMNMAPNGTSSLLGMREDLQQFLQSDASLKVVDADFVHLFSSWFNRGFLRIQEISWNTPATVLEKIIEHEAVHAIVDWSDLRRRLAQDRRCYGFFHPALPGEPLIFIEVALTNELSGAVQPLLNSELIANPEDADTAIFYSISNCQNGLRGISLGNFLIKQVVMELKQELPNITTFSTLSPVPQFRIWLEQEIEKLPVTALTENNKTGIWSDPELSYICTSLKDKKIESVDDLQDLDDTNLVKLCAYYLTQVKKAKMPFDPVARFHLGNGARLERINRAGDTSNNGLSQSFGLMVNYLYDLPSIEKNHEAFINNSEIVTSDEVSRVIEIRK